MKSMLMISVLLVAFASSRSEAGAIYNFQFSTSQVLGNTGVDGEVTGYFRVNNATGIVNSVSDAFSIDELVITSDTSGTGFVPLNTNLFTYSDSVYSGWQLLSYNSFTLDGVNYTGGSIYFAGISGGSVGGLRSYLALGIDNADRVGIIVYNPDGGVDLGRRKYAVGDILRGNTQSISANSVPEPSTLCLVLVGIAGAGLTAGRSRRKWA